MGDPWASANWPFAWRGGARGRRGRCGGNCAGPAVTPPPAASRRPYRGTAPPRLVGGRALARGAGASVGWERDALYVSGVPMGEIERYPEGAHAPAGSLVETLGLWDPLQRPRPGPLRFEFVDINLVRVRHLRRPKDAIAREPVGQRFQPGQPGATARRSGSGAASR